MTLDLATYLLNRPNRLRTTLYLNGAKKENLTPEFMAAMTVKLQTFVAQESAK
jgi:hypothetical protein